MHLAARPSRSGLLLLLAALTALVLLPSPARAGAAPGGTAQLRIGHFVAGLGSVVADIGGQPLGGPVSYGELADYVDVPAGTTSVSLRAAEAPETILTTVEISLAADGAGTVVAAGTTAAPTSMAFLDDLSTPPQGAARVRLLHLAPEVPAVDSRVAGGGPQLIAGAQYGQATAYQDMPPGVYDVDMLRAGTDQVLLAVRGVTVQAGSVYTMVGTGGGDEPVEVKGFVDAAGAGSVPNGGVAAGLGGASAAGASAAAGPLVGETLLVTVGSVMVLLAAAALVQRLRGSQRA